MAEKTKPAASGWTALLPNAELLKEWEGVEEGLRRRRSLSTIGWVLSVTFGVLQVAVAALDSSWFAALSSGNLTTLLQQWYLTLPLVLGIGFFVLYRWSRFWLKESEQPFRYTCSIEDFTLVGDEPAEPKLKWLAHDLARRMNERIGRLRFAEESKAEIGEASSHINVRGHYILRKNAEGQDVVEVLTRVRIGGSARPETLGRFVPFVLQPQPSADGPRVRKAAAGKNAPVARVNPDADKETKAARSKMSVEEYQLLLERVYFSGASEIYRQIREDVTNKIDLLPTRRFKAVALFHEAEDYARSGTLDAYEPAGKLYQQCAWMLHPGLKPLPEAPLRRRFVRSLRECHYWLARMRCRAAKLRPAWVRNDVLCARAQLGYATMLLQRRTIAAASGLGANAVFEAPPVAREAIRVLKAMPEDAPGRREALYRGNVVLAWASAELGDHSEAKKRLQVARGLDPGRAENDAYCQVVDGLLEAQPMQRIERLRKALELEPEFEMAAYLLALAKEDQWRGRPGLERRSAEEVIELYKQVVTANPGLIGAWANSGYPCWLLATDEDPRRDYKEARRRERRADYLELAKRYFSSGRQFKEIKQQTFVAELDYGLARIAAEQGDFDAAHRHCAEIASSMFSEGMDFTDYYFSLIGPAMVQRFERYRQRATKACEKQLRKRPSEERVCKTVLAFVLNDCGQAYMTYYWRMGERRYLQKSRQAFEGAIELDSAFPAPYRNLAKLISSDQPEEANQYLERCLELSPNWPFAIVEMAAFQGQLVRDFDKRAQALEEGAKEAQKNAERAERQAQNKSAKADELKRQILREAGSRELEAEVEKAVREASDSEDERMNARGQEWTKWEAAVALRDKAARSEDAAREHAQKLLPHSWLRVGPDGQQTIDLQRAIRRGELKKDQRWEREFSDWNAVALHTYAEALVMRPGSTGGGQPSGKRSDLLAFAREHFWPARVDSLLALRHAHAKLESEDAKNLRMQIEHWIAADPVNYSALNWGVTDEVVSKKLSKSLDRIDLSPATLAWIGRHLEETGQKEDALKACRRAVADQSTLGVDDADDPQTLHDVGLCCERLEAWDDALKVWQKILSLSAEDADAGPRCAVAFWMCDRHDQAIQTLKGMAKAYPTAGGWRESFVSSVSRRGRARLDSPGRQQLRAWLESQQSSTNVIARADAAEALLALAAAEPASRLVDESDQPVPPLLPVVTPIVLEGHADLFATESRADELLNKRLPQMRDRIHRDLGIIVPWVRVRANATDLERNTYTIALDEVPIASGRVYPDCKVCPDWPASEDAELSRVFNPLTGAVDAVVVPSERRDAVEANGRTLWDHWEYMSRHLELQLRLHAAQSLGVDELQNLLDAWCRAEKDDDERQRRYQLVQNALPDRAARLALLNVLRGLIDEQVPIKDLRAALEEFADQYPRGVGRAEMVDALRWRLRPALSSSASLAFIVHLSPALEERMGEALVTRDGEILWMIERAAAEIVLTEVRDALKGVARPALLVVRDRRVRYPLWRLIRRELPRVSVFALRELPRELRSQRAGTAELQ